MNENIPRHCEICGGEMKKCTQRRFSHVINGTSCNSAAVSSSCNAAIVSEKKNGYEAGNIVHIDVYGCQRCGATKFI